MYRSPFLLVAAFTVAASRAPAQEVFPDIEYISGHAGMQDKIKGVLVLDSTQLRFQTKDGQPLFVIQLAGVTDVGNQTDIRDASVGKKLLFGAFAGSRKQEFVQITYETSQMAEGIVFKVKQGVGIGIVAKVKFAVKKVKGTPPATDTTKSHQGPPSR
jgi:hypothetical protein